jgi:hypothetical protein
MILIFGHRADPHVEAVARSLERDSRSYSVVDSYSQTSDGLNAVISSAATLRIAGKTIRLSDIKSVWWRQKPKFTVPTESTTSLYDYFFVHREWNQVIDYLGTETMHIFSINNRFNAAIANNKITQLKLAEEAGFGVPRTLISNDFDAIMNFVAQAGEQKCIFKPFTPYMPPSGTITYATQIDTSHLLESRDRLIVAPGIYQYFVKKAFELRVNVVGGDVFAARVNSKHSARTEVDWRQEIYSDIYSTYEPENGFVQRLLALHRKFGLFFGVYDFIVTDDGEYVFLEVNPSGQWMWLESRLGFPISGRIASALGNR